MAAGTRETDVLRQIIQTGQISIADLALRFDDPPSMLRTLDGLIRSGEVEIDQPVVLDPIISQISQLPQGAPIQESMRLLQAAPAAQSVVWVTSRGVRKAG